MIPLPRRLRPIARTLLVAGSIGLAASCSDPAPTTTSRPGEAVTIAANPTGGYLWATIDGTVFTDDDDAIGSVDVSTDGQRGLVGLAVDERGRVFVSYTNRAFELITSELEPGGDERIVWVGPVTTQGGNGGRMIAVDGDLIIGIGLLNDRDGQADPASIVGKMIAIDPDLAPEDQSPEVLSGPWNNPFAFAQTPDGELWVADNHPRDGDERLARGDLGIDPEVALVLPADSAPSGMAATADSLYVCSYNELTLTRYDRSSGAPVEAEVVAEDCVLDVVVLNDGDLVYSTGTAIVQLTPG